MSAPVGMPLDLLAHWQYRATSLRGDVYKCETKLRDLERPAVSRISIVSETTEFEVEAVRDELYHLNYLVAEAEYWTCRLDLEVRYVYLGRANDMLEDYLNRVAEVGREVFAPEKPEPLDMDTAFGDVRRVVVSRFNGNMPKFKVADECGSVTVAVGDGIMHVMVDER